MPTAAAPAAPASPRPTAPDSPLWRAAADDAVAERALALQQMPTDFIICRGDRHDLQTERGYGVNVYDTDLARDVLQKNWAWRKASCKRCGYEVETWYDHVFSRVTSFAKHPKDYLLKGMGRAAPAEARAELWRRTVGSQPGD